MRCRPPGLSSIVEPASISMVEGEADPPGTRLALRPMAEELRLSVIPVREALRMLENDGLVTREAHRGTRVTSISKETVLELIGARTWLDVLAIQEAAPLHTAASLARARAELGAAEAAANDGDPSGYTHANRRLHEALEAPASSTLLGLIGDTWDRLWRSRRQMALFSLMPQRISNVQCEHYEILDALVRGEASRAAEAMTRHRDSTLAAWQAALAGIEEGVSAEQS
jgi:DNA-binding GntR family transcriptional regulator